MEDRPAWSRVLVILGTFFKDISDLRSNYAHRFVYIVFNMAAVIDYTNQNVFTEFSGSSEEDVSYATNFWQSIQLHPPMESRLVSSDIKQRLKIAPPSSQLQGITFFFLLNCHSSFIILINYDFLNKKSLKSMLILIKTRSWISPHINIAAYDLMSHWRFDFYVYSLQWSSSLS